MKSRKLTIKLVAFLMALMMTILTLPIHIFASTMDDTTDSTETDTVSTQNDIAGVYVVKEDTTLREENVKHFSLSNGLNKAVAYSQPVHYLDENGNWVDIDNALTLSGNEYKTSNKTEIKFANKSGSNGLVSIKDGNYKIDFTPLSTNKVSVVIENPQSNNSRKFDDVKALNNLVSKATYQNIYNGIDFEYILVGNNIKENIIVKEKQESYAFSFELKLNKLSAELVNGAIILSDYDTGEQVYKIPAPYMVDANGVMSTDVEYSLVQNNKWKYTFTVIANNDWINSNDRIFPVTIDPTVVANTVGTDISITSNGEIESTYLSIGNFTYNGVSYKDVPGFIKFTEVADIPEGNILLNAKLAMFLICVENTGNTDFYIGAYRATQNWTDNSNFTYATSRQYYDNTSISSVRIQADGTYEWDITSLYKQWKSGTANHGICVKAVNLPIEKNANARITTIENTGGYLIPQLELTYVDARGLEEYYATLNTSLGSIGKSNVNLYNGSLTYVNNLTTVENHVLSYEINMIYSSIDKAWTSSFNENIKPFDDFNDGIVRYVWTDADGTIHNFAPYLQKNYWGAYVQYEQSNAGDLWEMTNPVVFYPEDDIDYVLKKTANGEFILQDYNGNQKMFDISGRLSKICDAQGNVLFLSYENEKLSCIDFVGEDNIQIPQIEFSYDSNNKLSTVSNFVTGLEIYLTWNVDCLSKIVYDDIEDAKDNTIDIYYSTNSNTIEKIADTLESQYLKFTFNTNKSVSIVQKYSNSNILQYRNNITYNSANTVCTDFGDDISSSTDNIREKYTFDGIGRKTTRSEVVGYDSSFTLTDSWTYDDDILPDGVYYTVSYSSNINKELDILGNDGDIIYYDINTKQESLLSLSDLYRSNNVSNSTTSVALDETSIVVNEIMEDFLLYDSNNNLTRDIIWDDTGDTRQHISDEIVSQEPYNSICFLRMFYNGEPYRGTGFLIGPNILLTAAHNVFFDTTNNGNPTFTENIHVYVAAQTNLNNAGQYVPESPYGVIEVEAFYLQQTYCNLSRTGSDNRFNYDWAICILETDIGNQVGWFDISITPNSINNSEISIIGYPGDKRKGEKYDMFLSNGSVVADDYIFSYDADTFSGNSGSPVFINNGSFIVIGMHVKGFDENDNDTSNDFNGATKINSLICTVSAVLKSSE